MSIFYISVRPESNTFAPAFEGGKKHQKRTRRYGTECDKENSIIIIAVTSSRGVTGIQGSVLEKSGTAKEMLAKVYYMTENYPSDSHLYVPQKNNIFCTGLDFLGQDDTWTTIKIRPQRFRCEYIIK